MTPSERRDEIVEFLGKALHRLHSSSLSISESSPPALEDREDDRLSVSQETTKGGEHANS